MGETGGAAGVIGLITDTGSVATVLKEVLGFAYRLDVISVPESDGPLDQTTRKLASCIGLNRPCLFIFTTSGPLGTGYATRRVLNRMSAEIAAIPALYFSTDQQPPRVNPEGEPPVFQGWVPDTVKPAALLRIIEQLSGVAPARAPEKSVEAAPAALRAAAAASAMAAAPPPPAPAPAPQPAPAPAAVAPAWTRRICAHCRRWTPRDEDRYCSGCGGALQSLALDTEQIVLTLKSEDQKQQNASSDLRSIRVSATGHCRLTNSGSNTTTFSIQSRGLPNLQAEPPVGALAGGENLELKLRVPPTVIQRGQTFEGTLEVLSPGAEPLRARLLQPSPPLATLNGPTRVTLIHPEQTSFELELANAGGGRLVTLALRVDPSLQAPPLPAPLEAGARQLLRFSVDTSKLNAGTHEFPVGIQFEDYPTLQHPVTCELVKPALIRLTPNALRHELLAPGRSGVDEIEIYNPGEQKLDVERIESNLPWMTVQFDRAQQDQRRRFKIRWTAPTLPGKYQGALVIHSNAHGQPMTTLPVEMEVADLPRYPYPAGIDFGTTASCVAWINEAGAPELLKTAAGDTLIPSLLYIERDGEIKVGETALERAKFDPGRAIQAIKRIVGRQQGVRIGEETLAATALVAELLKHLRKEAEDALKRAEHPQLLDRAILTVPADLPEAQLQLAAEAAGLAGLGLDAGRNGFIDEPTAAAFCYAYQVRQGPECDWPSGDENILVFDFGGGTLDCAIVRIISSPRWRLEVVATASNLALGGEDIDRALVEILVRKAAAWRSGFDPETIQLPREQAAVKFGSGQLDHLHRSRWAFKTTAERAKIVFAGTAATVKVKVSPVLVKAAKGYAAESIELELSRAEFNTALDPILVSAQQVLDQVLAVAGLDPSAITAVLHTGRTSQISRVFKEINQRLPNATDASRYVQVKTCVAMGASLWGYFQEAGDEPIELKRLGRLPWSFGYRAIAGLRREFRAIFPRGCTFPNSAQVTLPILNGRKILELLEQTEGGERRVGLIRLQCDPATPEMTIDFQLDEDRCLHASCDGHSLTIETAPEKESDALVTR